MLYLLAMCALVFAQQHLLAGDVSPDTSDSKALSEEWKDASGTGEVDEDVIITDEEDTNEDEGVTS